MLKRAQFNPDNRKAKSVQRSPAALRFLGLGNDDIRNTLTRVFALRDRVFFRKKKPATPAYPFRIVDPYEVFGEDAGRVKFTLIGDNWLNGSEKPIVFLWGFNNWKWGFIADYLAEYRVAFAPRKISAVGSLWAIWKFPSRPASFAFWGYTEPKWLGVYARSVRLPIYRIEDGFLRSSTLGASHSTPYSLVVDGSGLHYNPTISSDLENILNNHDFSEQEIADARFCISLMREHNLSKYNAPAIRKTQGAAIRNRKRVAVLGQVDNDMSMRLGNLNGWTMIDLIRLARYENPNAEVIYRPHPEVYEGYQRSKFKRKQVEAICEIQSPHVPVAEFLDSVDHVYTVTSLTGFEALIRGKKVTVVGAAFYAGWGLTDDRVDLPRRQKRRTLEEVFAASYLKYSRYLCRASTIRAAFHATALRILADKQVAEFDVARKTDLSDASEMKALFKTDWWPSALLKCGRGQVDGVISDVNWQPYLGQAPGRIYQSLLLNLVCGKLDSEYARNGFLSRVRNYIDLDLYAYLLLNLGKRAPGAYVATQFAWLLGQDDEFEEAYGLITRRLRETLEEQAQRGEGEETVSRPPCLMDADEAALMGELLDLKIANKDFSEALELALELAVCGYGGTSLVFKVGKIAESMFDIKSLRDIAIFMQKADLYAENRRAVTLGLNGLVINSENVRNDILPKEMALEIRLNPERVNNAFTLSRKYAKSRKHMDEVIVSWLNMDNDQTVQKAISYLEIDEPERSLALLDSIIDTGGENDRVRVAYAKGLISCERYEDAVALLQRARKLEPTEANYKESIRLLCFLGRFQDAFDILVDAENKQIEVGAAFAMPVCLGLGDIEAGYKHYLSVPFREQVSRYFRGKYHKEECISKLTNVLVMAVYGPGDEIRFASLYQDILDRFGKGNFRITCDYRFHKLLTDSFPDIEFIPVKRSREFSENYPHALYDKLPGAELSVMLDNSCLDYIEQAQSIVMVTDLIWHFRKNYDSFPGEPFLVCDEERVVDYKKRLSTGVRHVGLCWRSSLTTRARNVHYLSVEELAPLLEIPGIQFVNFQYDDCQDELAWIEENFPGKVIDFGEIDHYNDFNSVAALMKCMDLMIAPATSVAELSAALGCETWLFSNSGEIDWRKTVNDDRDVWQSTMTIIEGEVKGDKDSLVAKVKARLEEWSLHSASDSSPTMPDFAALQRLR